jgi:sulfite exporter TauE/SafE
VAVQTIEPNYEFSPQQDAVFQRLAGAVAFVGAAMMVPGAVLAVLPAYLFSTRGPSLGEGLVAVLGILLIVMGVNLVAAAQHFKRIATTEGHDIENLMVAMGEVARVYAVQRWLWVALAFVLIVAITTSLTVVSL